MANAPAAEPLAESCTKLYRICLVYNRAANASHLVKKAVKNRVIDPDTLPAGTWAVQHFENRLTRLNGETLNQGARAAQLTLIAARLYTGRDFQAAYNEESKALGHDGKRPVIQLPPMAYAVNADDLSNQFRVVPRGARVIDRQGEIIWPRFCADGDFKLV